MKVSKYFFLFILSFSFISYEESSAELLKPSNGYKPLDVVKIQLSALKNNDKPYKNAGIEQTWEFAHPSNKKFTGPLLKFIKLLNGSNYNILLNHIDHKIVEIFKSDKKFVYEVTVLDKENFFFKYNWQIEKFIFDGPLNNCWLTTSVSSPEYIGSLV